MRGAAWPLTIFATLLVLMGVMNRLWESSTIMSATFAFAAGVIYVIVGVSVLIAGREPLRRGGPSAVDRVRAVPAASLGAAVMGVGAGALAAGFVFGASLVIAAGLLLAGGAALLARELGAQRHAVARERRS